jgi:hypothetical protein
MTSGRTPAALAATAALRSSVISWSEGSLWPGAQNEFVIAARKPAAVVSRIFLCAAAGSGSRMKYSQTPTSKRRSSSAPRTP